MLPLAVPPAIGKMQPVDIITEVRKWSEQFEYEETNKGVVLNAWNGEEEKKRQGRSKTLGKLNVSISQHPLGDFESHRQTPRAQAPTAL